jgi:secretion/DNA translocation related TadE-like protein
MKAVVRRLSCVVVRVAGADPDGGVATVWASAAVAVLVAFTLFGVDLGAAEVARHRVEAAADLAALAGAAHAADGEPVACAYSDRIAAAMNTWLGSCRLVGWEVFVELRATVALPPVAGAQAWARARAGPVG